MNFSESKGSILLADDEATFTTSMTQLLRDEGYDCVSVSDGLAAAAELNSHPHYDLLIADIKMEGNKHLELVQHLPQLLDGLPVILVTAYPDAASRMKSVELPVLSYLIKPVRTHELLPLVRRAIAHSAVHRANQAIAKRLEGWKDDTQSAAKLLSRASPGPGIAPDVFINLWLRNLAGCLSDLQALDGKLKANDPSMSPRELSDAIAATIRALDVSAGGFRK